MNILIIGSGGREHAIAWKVSQSKIVSKIYAIPGNPGISKEKKVENFEIENPSIQDYIRFAKSKNIDLCPRIRNRNIYDLRLSQAVI